MLDVGDEMGIILFVSVKSLLKYGLSTMVIESSYVDDLCTVGGGGVSEDGVVMALERSPLELLFVLLSIGGTRVELLAGFEVTLQELGAASCVDRSTRVTRGGGQEIGIPLYPGSPVPGITSIPSPPGDDKAVPCISSCFLSIRSRSVPRNKREIELDQ